MRPKKSLSQNFLTNDRAAKRIVDSLDIQEGDTVLEIGAGKGALTKYLLEKAKKTVAVEIDKKLCQYLEQRFTEKNNLVLINKDILKIDWGNLAGKMGHLKVIGNLPYRITSPLLSLLLENREFIPLSVLMVQKEVAKRICAQPGSKDWSPLSITVQLHADVKTLFHLRPTSFYPSPKVESSVIKIVFLKRPRVFIADENLFLLVVRSAFGQRRKIILNSLSANLNLPKTEVELILNKVKIDPKRRPETLSIQEFAKLSSALGNLLNCFFA
ncbi:MAG: 16S rRNA (adenine(1518)-N(6)/adenine(1519)-N(6))-dimethyltransferase RsmA [candidate division Zixibacteria bacterium]|nr:16S rRNA (adenine(1518)-N(6)/adenine(1519)-N(6))-dimethyltransferase RsmA [candidate division Zixibacteria bacterium]